MDLVEEDLVLVELLDVGLQAVFPCVVVALADDSVLYLVLDFVVTELDPLELLVEECGDFLHHEGFFLEGEFDGGLDLLIDIIGIWKLFREEIFPF